MDGRWMVHLPWCVAVLLVALLLLVQGLVLLPHQVESARMAATESVRATLARDLSFIQSQVLLGDLANIQDFISASSALPGMEEMTLVSPEGVVVASSEIGREGQSLEATEDPELRALAEELKTRFAPRLLEDSTARTVTMAVSIAFQSANPSLRDLSHGILYQRRSLTPIIEPVVAASRYFMVATALLVLVFAVPLQIFVYHVVTRRLQLLARDVARFGEGSRTGLFEDRWNDHIGRISALLRDAIAQVRDREESDQRLSLALESANAGIWDWRMDGDLVHTNAQYHSMFGDIPANGPISSAELLDRIHPADQRRVRDIILGLHEPGNDAYHVEFRMRGRSNDSYLWIRSTGRVVERALDGSAARMLGQHVDISEQKVLQARTVKFFEGVDHAISVFDRDCRIVMLNGVAATRLGVSAGDAVGRSINDFVPNVREHLAQRIASVLATGGVHEWEDHIEVRGSARWFHTIMQPMEDDEGAPSWVMTASYEVTERKESEESARAQEARYRTLVESTSAILWEADPVTFQMTFVNKEAEAVLGYAPSVWLENVDFWQSHIHPLDRGWVVDFCATMTARCESHSFEYRMVRADGSTVWLRDVVSVLSSNGVPERLVGVMIDITREKHEEERFQAAFESIPIGTLLVDEEGVVLLANPAAVEMFGYQDGMPQGISMCELVPEVTWQSADVEALGGRSPWLGELNASKEYTGRRQNRDQFAVRLAVGEMQREGGHTYVCSVTDLSQIKHLEAQLAQAQRMEAVGQLAGGIAHDFNNLLHVINGFVELARQSQPDDAPVQRELEQIALAGKRAATLTSQLLAFSRRQVMKPENLDLNVVITRTASMLERVIGEHIKLDVIASPRLATVYADQGMLEQVLMNLCVNARDAMLGGGSISIETENVVINGTYSRDHVWAKPGRYVLITVTDTGTGMDAETTSRVFEPFFTTKALHQGTGLGLSTVYGIVKQHDGMITVYSEVGKGTTFKIYLPQAERLAADVGTKIEGAIPTGDETILVVEDDDSVRHLTRAILEGAGYAVLDASDGRKAVQCFRENHTDINLVLLDVVMPDMGGREALDEMLKIAPELKALFASGYSENAIHTNFVLDKGLSLLKKPYSRGDLLRAIRRLLDEDGSAGIV